MRQNSKLLIFRTNAIEFSSSKVEFDFFENRLCWSKTKAEKSNATWKINELVGLDLDWLWLSNSHRLTVSTRERLGEHLISLIFVSSDDANGKWFIGARQKKYINRYDVNICGMKSTNYRSAYRSALIVSAGNYWRCFYSIFTRLVLTTAFFLLSELRWDHTFELITRTFGDNLNLHHF